MARGAESQENTLNSAAGQQLGTAQGLYNTVTGDANSIMASPGFSKSQINTQMNAALTPIAGAKADAQAQLANRSAATRNDAGMVAGQDAIARHAMSQGSQAAYGVQANADQTALNERDKALGVEASLYAPTLGSATGLYGNATQAMNARNSWIQNLSPFLSAGAQAAGAYAAGKK